MRGVGAALGSGHGLRGDGPEIGHDDLSPVRPPLVSPEARALAGLVLVATSPFFGQVFQFLSFIVFERFGSGQSPALQYAMYAGPVGGLAAVGVVGIVVTVAFDRSSF